MKKIVLSVALLAGSLAYAGGFRVSLQGVRQLAQAHTSAHTEDASVAFFNPAGISFIPAKLSIAAGGFGARTQVTYQNPATLKSYETNNPLGTPLYAAVAYKVTEDLSLGMSVTTPFGSTIQYGEDFSGQEIVQKMQLKAFFFQPMVAVKLAPWVSLGASYIYAKGSVNWDKAATLLNGTVNINDEEASGQGFGLGFYFRPKSNLDISLAYRSPVDMNADNGTLTVDTSAALFPVLGLDANGQDRFTSTLPLAGEFTAGVTYRATPKWSISADANFTGWSRYDKLTLDFDNAVIGNQADNTVLTNPKNFKNTITLRLGTEYKFNDLIAGRLGYYYDESPYEDKDFIPETPSFDSNVITAGVGLNFKNGFGVDVAGGYALPKARTFNNTYLNFSGQAKAKAYYFGLGLSYNLIKK